MLSNVREIQSNYPRKQRARNYISSQLLQTRIAKQNSLLIVNHTNLKYLITPASMDSGGIRVSVTVIFAMLRLHTSVLIVIQKKGNDTYIYTYMYKFGIELPKEAHTLVLPKDENIAVFAITLSDNYIDNISAANEMRTLPLEVSK